MKKLKWLIVAVVIVIVLTATFLMGGSLGGDDSALASDAAETAIPADTAGENPSVPADSAPQSAAPSSSGAQDAQDSGDEGLSESPEITLNPASETQTVSGTVITAPGASASPTPAAAATPAATPSPTPTPQSAAPSCTLSVNCVTALKNLDKLADGKAEILPSGGSMYYETGIEFTEGESAFNVLQRELKNKGVHLDYSYSIAFGTNYIRGIGNLYEFDCGGESGWLYKVNGVFQSAGSSAYILSDGDVIEFVYTCNNGVDVGGNVPGV